MNGPPASKRMRSAALAELRRVGAARAKLDARAAKLIGALEVIQAQQADLADTQAALVRLSGPAPDPPLAVPGDVLEGRAIRTAAVRVLMEVHGPGRAAHYRDWYRLLRSAGYSVGGQDPRAVFLTQLSRSPVVRRSTQPGVYEVDDGAPARLRRALASHLAELRDLSAVIAEHGLPTSAQSERRAYLTSRARRLEGELAEADECLRPAADGVERVEQEVELPRGGGDLSA